MVASEQVARCLNNTQANQLRNDIVGVLKNANPYESNITSQERKALKDLSNNKNITILPADKGGASVLLDTENYKYKVGYIFSDTNTYE